jgi:polar amino acid transport system substrate-binding protein
VPPPSPAARADLAPTGKLRAGINYTNMILVQKDPASGDSRGPAIDLTRELGKRLGVPVELVAYTSVGTMVDGAKAGAWDIAFLGSDPARAGEMDFTAAYLELEATYLVPAGSRLLAVADVDQDGVRVAAPARANYELYLSRSLQRANLVRAENADAAFNLLVSGRVEALAGLRQALLPLTEKLPGSRILDGRFMAVQQSVAT